MYFSLVLVVHGSVAPRWNMKPRCRPTDCPPSSLTDMQDKYYVDFHNISTLVKAITKETTKEVARPKATPPLLWCRPHAATFVLAFNRVNIAAVNALLVLHVGKTACGVSVERH